MRIVRRFFRLVLITAAAAATLLYFALVYSKPCFKGGENYVLFAGDNSLNCREINAGSVPAFTKLTTLNVCGECVTYRELDVEEFIKSVNGKIVFTEALSDSVNYYCKASLPYSVNLYGEQINLHICVKGDGVKVGTPIIFGGY